MVYQSIKQIPRIDVIEDSNRETTTLVCFCLDPLSQTYHIRLSSIINIIMPELFEFSEKITDRNSMVVTCRGTDLT
jgi:hypothetical protein